MTFFFPVKVNQPKFNQRRISSAKFLGELYNYRMVESAVIFRTLYSFTSFGVNPDGSPSPLDPPEHLFRIRLVCTILDTCGQYFDRGSSKRKLDCFLVYFQVLIHFCHSSTDFFNKLMYGSLFASLIVLHYNFLESTLSRNCLYVKVKCMLTYRCYCWSNKLQNAGVAVDSLEV